MAPVQFRQPQKDQRIKIKALQFTGHQSRLLGQQLGNVCHYFLQREDVFFRRRFMHLIRCGLVLNERLPCVIQPRQRRLEAGRRSAAQGAQRRVVELAGVHQSRALHQVVRLIDQQAHAPAFVDGVREQVCVQVKKVVVVAHHHIAPSHHFLAKVIGANIMLQSDAA